MLHRGARGLLLALLLGGAVRGADAGLDAYAAVEAAPVTTSIYIGSVALSAGRFVRHDGTYVAPYTAKVFPFFFSSEKGELRVDVSDDALRRLAAGATIEFTGTAIRSDGRIRAISGRAAPLDAVSGHLKVRVIVSRRIVLVFNTTYRLAGTLAPAPGSPGHAQ